jgi:hypothetical protein
MSGMRYIALASFQREPQQILPQIEPLQKLLQRKLRMCPQD